MMEQCCHNCQIEIGHDVDVDVDVDVTSKISRKKIGQGDRNIARSLRGSFPVVLLESTLRKLSKPP